MKIKKKKLTKKMKEDKKARIQAVVRASLLIVLALSVISLTIAQNVDQQESDFNVCCEKTRNGAWCQNTREENCDAGFRKTPTSCDATSFCKLGVCVDSEEGICDKNTPQKVCQISTGTWIDDDTGNIPQCTLGCCLIGDQASFVTLTRCKRISNVYGLETNFKNDVTDEVQCILMAFAQDTGACVVEQDGERNCVFTTRDACTGTTRTGNLSGDTEFFKDYLCSADELATDCGPTRETICLDGHDEVYFKDSCGNRANIYDSNRIYSNDPAYWQRVVPKSESCGPTTGNIESRSCGNCNYLQGSLCGEGNAIFGDLYCKDLNCKDTQNGNTYRNGESWCEYMGPVGQGQDTVGSRHFRHVCVQGEEIIEPCADFRNEVCIQQSMGPDFGEFQEAACRVNRWTDCIDQFTEEDCLNTDRRDCYWAKGLHYDGSGSDRETGELANQGNLGSRINNDEDSGFFEDIFGGDDDVVRGTGIVSGGHICLPNVPPGFEFWEDGNADSLCDLGNSRQLVQYKETLFGDPECEENCEPTQTNWIDTMNNVCMSLGDCGAHVNYLGKYTDNGIVWKQNGRRKNIQTGVFEDVQESSIGNNNPVGGGSGGPAGSGAAGGGDFQEGNVQPDSQGTNTPNQENQNPPDNNFDADQNNEQQFNQ